MCELTCKIKDKRNDILMGEIGALLHDIGKMHPYFLKHQSIERTTSFSHENISNFLDPILYRHICDSAFDFTIMTPSNIKNLIEQHHKHSQADDIVKYLQKCDRKDSADDKGIVRRKQSINNTIISSPFGFENEKIDLSCLQKRFDDLQNNLIELFENYSDIISFRKSLIGNLKTAFSHALGETRIPANDVTLWDHSYSTASLFKTILAGITCDGYKDVNDLKWRIFGICWNGENFINHGRKIADIQKRAEIIREIKTYIKRTLEEEYPIGNVIYEDVNGIYFTFPNLNEEDLGRLAVECADKILSKVVYRKCNNVMNIELNNELWPFFTLSKPSGSLTIIANELKRASEKRGTPKISPFIFIGDEDRNEELINSMPDLDRVFDEVKVKDGRLDVCPVCGIRPKNERDEMCSTCRDRRKGRLEEWLKDGQESVWIDEVADKNNRVSLISLGFDLDKWLDGTMINTILSQSFKDWGNSKKVKDFLENEQYKNKLKKRNISLTDDLKQLSKELLSVITNEDINKDSNFKSSLINIYFEDISSSQEKRADDYVGKFVANLKSRLDSVPFDPSNLQTLLFTQNPSPARIYRVWRETQEFFETVVEKIKRDIYSHKWKRVAFSVDYKKLQSALKRSDMLFEKTPYVIRLDGLEPRDLLVLHVENGEFCTIESLEKYRYADKSGEEAVRESLERGLTYLALESNPNNNLLKDNSNIEVNKEKTKHQEYMPLIEITISPMSLRLIVPTLDSIKITKMIATLYSQRFEKVLGKLPLNMKILTANRKFPLYVLLDAERRMLDDREFKKPVKMNPWWNVYETENDDFFKFYPTRLIGENEKYTLDDLSSISKGRLFSLYPGYFDFDLLTATTDKYNIYYEDGKRGDETYRLYSKRPCYFYQISMIRELWDILSNLSSSQINNIEEALTTKLREWRYVEDGSNKREVFMRFAEATIKDAFGSIWDSLREETRCLFINSLLNGLLMDTIFIFRHMIKEEKEIGE
ncbi:CRISPR-associated protein Csx11 [Acetomicrobium sp.]|uniref:CRISPR-associated protein Csx11 n=1 Tax=Acetomicrobium sp. TaxID=1872099 RepID=UPI001BCBF2BF|nr:CRISPR-associated protein Csx11 [Acetomicrobium sp.]